MSTADTTLAQLREVVRDVIAPNAPGVDQTGRFPHESIEALGRIGVLGLISHPSVGGAGAELGDAARAVRAVAAACGSTAMVLAMHYSAVQAIEAHGPLEVRRAIAAGTHLSTLAFSESGSRSHFWAPLSTATVDGDHVVLEASKSWVTSASAADSYVWTSRPAEAAAGASLWLVPRNTAGIEVVGRFDGLGLRGNGSCPVTASGARIPTTARLGDDGAGLDLAFAVVLPTFLVLNASASIGMTDAALAACVELMKATRFEHLGATLGDQPVPRTHLARLANAAASAAALVDDALRSLAEGRVDATIRMLQAKTVAGETAVQVLDLAMRIGGGSAFRKDLPIERLFRDTRASVVMAPTVDASNEFVARLLLGMPLFDGGEQ